MNDLKEEEHTLMNLSSEDSSDESKKKKKINVDQLNVDTSPKNDMISLDLPTTPTTTVTPIGSEELAKEEYVKKEEYDKLIKTQTETVSKLTHDFNLVVSKYKKEM